MDFERGFVRRPVIAPRTLALSAWVLAWAAAPPAQVPGESIREPLPPASQTRETTPGGEVVVVTASRREEQLINAPATMTVITADDIRRAPSRNLADLLRLVPGINVVQLAARDVNVTSRTAAGTLTNTLLVLLDGRSIYQDFFGAVLWDFLPIDPDEIKQIEVIRGPASAVWGANALTGVVNVITKTPREMSGSSLALRLGLIDRTRDGEGFDGGGLFSTSAIHAGAPNDRFAFKISAGLLAQEAFLRPLGTVANRSTPYPPFPNSATTQPKLDARADYDFADTRQRLTLAGGIAGTEGIVHSGLGPFDILSGSTLKYGRITYWRNKLKLQAFVNALDAEAPVLLQTTPAGDPLFSTFENQVYDVEFSNQHVLKGRHLLSYGGNYRHNSFDLSLAPLGDNRDEGGIYVQDQLFLSERLRLILGGRMDVFDTLDKAVFSPRTALLVNVRPTHTVRLSFNRAFRSPSFVNNFFDVDFLSQADLPGIGPFRFRSNAVGNPNLREEQLTAYEAGYIGMMGSVTLGAAVYLNRLHHIIQFTQIDSYTSANPPAGWPLPVAALDAIAGGRGLPSQLSYENFDRKTEWGVELSIDGRAAPGISAFANYTWQATPAVSGFDFEEVNRAPRHRVNVGLAVEQRRYFGSISASLQDEAFWQDILDARFQGSTSPYAIVNGSIGVHSMDHTMTVAVRGTNLLNHDTQQHVFGDLIKRGIIAELRWTF